MGSITRSWQHPRLSRPPISHYPYGALCRKLVRPNGYPNHLYPPMFHDEDTHSCQKRYRFRCGHVSFRGQGTRFARVEVYAPRGQLSRKGTTPTFPGDISSAAIVMSSTNE